MKRAAISTIFTLISAFTLAQNVNLVASHYPAKGTPIAITTQKTEISEDKSISNISYNSIDGDGNSYSSVKIGSQTWMVENLKTTKFNDGTKIPLISDNKEWSNLDSPGFCWYNNNAGSYKNHYGALYNWYTVNTGKLCPLGWHIPSQEEWNTLINYCGENIAGGHLKEIGTEYWESPNVGATNATGFAARPGGSRWDIGNFSDKGLRGRWWSSTEFNNSNVWYSNISSSYSRVTGSLDDKKNGLSVRCIKD